MHKWLAPLLIVALSSCNQNNTTRVQALGASVAANVIATCEKVVWTEPALSWKDDSTLGTALTLHFNDGYGNRQPVAAGTLTNKTIVLSQVGEFILYNASYTNLGQLNSTFTCAKTGQTVTATTKLQSYGNSASALLRLDDAGKLTAVWAVF